MKVTGQVTPGVQAIQNFAKQVLARITDLREGQGRIQKQIFGLIQENFATSGRLSGGWAPLSRRYKERKAREVQQGKIKSTETNVRTGRLRESFTGGPDSVSEFDPSTNTFRIGSTVPYYQFIKSGTRLTPPRPVITASDQFRGRLRVIFETELSANVGRIKPLKK